MKTIFVIYMIVNGQLNPNPLVLDALSSDCHSEKMVVEALNKLNSTLPFPTLYTGMCGRVPRTFL
jgi:hypothetical protein